MSLIELTIVGLIIILGGIYAYIKWEERQIAKTEERVEAQKQAEAMREKLKNTLFLGTKASSVIKRQAYKSGYPLTPSTEPRGWLFIGEQGSGKTNAILSLIEKIQTRPSPCMRVFYDTKPDFYPRYLGENDAYVFGLGVEGSAVFQIFSEMHNEKDVDFIVNALVVDESDTSSANSEHFKEQTKLLLKAALLTILESHENPTNIELIDFLLEFDDATKFKDEIEKRGTARSYGISIASVLGGGKSDPQSASAWANFNKYATRLKRREFYTREGTSPTAIIKQFESKYRPQEEKLDIFLLNPATDQDSFSPWIRMFMGCLSRAIRSLENNQERRIWIVCDEFQTLGRFPELAEELPAQGRSKGACVLLSTQNLSKLQAVYGRDLTNAILSGAATKIFFRMGDPFSLGVAENIFGESIKHEPHTTISGDRTSFSVQQRTVKNISATSLSSLSVGEACVKIDNDIVLVWFGEVKTPEKHSIKRTQAPRFNQNTTAGELEEAKTEVYF